MRRDGLTQDFDAHALFTFAEIPESPILANRWARLKRWFVIAFVESWLAVFLFRLKTRLLRAHVPFLPGVCDFLSRVLFGVQIGDQVEIGTGLMITHGQVVIDGRTRIGSHCQINPWVTIGLSNSKKIGFSTDGPTIGDHVHIGTGAKILGPVRIGDYARIGANAVVVHDVPENVTVVGMPARAIGERRSAEELAADSPGRDDQLAAYMRASIVDYRLRRQSLRSLVDSLERAFSLGSERLQRTREAVRGDLAFLDSAAAAGGDQTMQVIKALEDIDAALSEHTQAAV